MNRQIDRQNRTSSLTPVPVTRPVIERFVVITGTSGTCITKSFPTPEDVRPFQKAGPRKRSNRGRKKRQTSILTDTTVKNALQIEKEKLIKRKLESAHHTMSQSVNSARTRYNNDKISVDKKFKNIEGRDSSLCVVLLKNPFNFRNHFLLGYVPQHRTLKLRDTRQDREQHHETDTDKNDREASWEKDGSSSATYHRKEKAADCNRYKKKKNLVLKENLGRNQKQNQENF
ncbi:hypothetical protein AVEN_100997-1 [Araneus ventricosus]|uniref:Uncharacterized protein n=1 Tax=Araneus ventricosus TaxID=182803 RepID=A0A4Y2PAS2_ARAVE|nr:hypothetical protein AVEN_100997-1 [Araneus ventricosus]